MKSESNYAVSAVPLPGLEARTEAVSQILQSLQNWRSHNFGNAVAYGAGLTEFLMGRPSLLPINIRVDNRDFPTVNKLLMTPEMRVRRLAASMNKAMAENTRHEREGNPDYMPAFKLISAWGGGIHTGDVHHSMRAEIGDKDLSSEKDVPLRVIAHSNMHSPHFSAISCLKNQSAMLDRVAIEHVAGETLTTTHKNWREDAEGQFFRTDHTVWREDQKVALREYFRQRARGRVVTPDLQDSMKASQGLHDMSLAEARETLERWEKAGRVFPPYNNEIFVMSEANFALSRITRGRANDTGDGYAARFNI